VGGLSTVTKAAIGVGVPVFVVLCAVVVGIFLLLWRRRQAQDSAEPEYNPAEDHKVESMQQYNAGHDELGGNNSGNNRQTLTHDLPELVS
jgi:choline-glycine betaine transporter